MSKQPQEDAPTDTHRGLRLLGLVAVAAGVLVLMAAAFVLSYTGIHAIALSAGISPRFARIYPVIFDAMLVVACAAVLALRGAGRIATDNLVLAGKPLVDAIVAHWQQWRDGVPRP